RRSIKVQRQPKLSRGWKLKITRHYSDYFVGFFIERDSLVDDAGVAGKTFLPEAVADHDNLIASGGFVFKQEGPAQGGLHAESLEEVSGHGGSGQTLRLAAAGQVRGSRHRDHRGKLFEGAVLITEVKIVERGNTRAVAAVANVPPAPNQTIRFGKRQRPD